MDKLGETQDVTFMFDIRKLLAAFVMAVCCPLGPASSLEFSDVGTLISSTTKDGTTYEKYSDGVEIQYTLKGYRKENSGKGRSVELKPGEETDPEEWIEDSLVFPPLSRAPNDAGSQSRLRQLIEICLEHNHAEKALDDAKKYYQIQQALKSAELPMAISKELLGRAHLQLGNRLEALQFLSDAVAIASKLNNLEIKGQFENQLTLARKQPETNKKPSSGSGKVSFAGVKSADSLVEVSTPGSYFPGFPNISLDFLPNQGCTFSTQDFRPGIERVQGLVATINGIPTHSLGEQAVVNLLQGPVGTPVTITFLDSYQSEKTTTLTREAAKKFGNDTFSKQDLLFVMNGFDCADCNEGSPEHVLERLAPHLEKQNLDIFVRAVVAGSMSEAQTVPGADKVFLARLAMESVIALDSIGAFNQAERLIPLAESDTTFYGTSPGSNFALSKEFIRTLSNAHRIIDCENLCRQYLRSAESANSTSEHYKKEAIQQAKRLYAEYLVARKMRDAPKILNELFKQDLYAQAYYEFNEDPSWLASIQEKARNYDLALLFFSKRLNELKLTDKAMSSTTIAAPLTIGQIRERAYLSWRIANLQFLQHKNAEALATLDAAIVAYDQAMKPELQKVVDKLCFFFPTKNELIEKRNAISKNEALPPLQCDRDEGAEKNYYWLLMARKKSQAGEQDAAKVVDGLLTRYKQAVPTHNYKRTAPNLFCGLMQVGRLLSDGGKHAEPNQLFATLKVLAVTKEHTAMAAVIPGIELALNADLQNKPSKIFWQPVDDFFVDKVQAYRQLANIYSAAGEEKRAIILIRRAQQELNRLNTSTAADSDGSLVDRSRTLLMLDRAKIEARTEHLAEALETGKEAIELCSRTAPAKKANANCSFNEAYRVKCVELARIFAAKYKHQKEAIELLSFASLKIKQGAAANVEMNGQTFYAWIDSYLAKLLFDEGRSGEALPVIKRAIVLQGNHNAGPTWLLAGQIAERENHFDDAAHYYSEANLTLNNYFDKHIRQSVLEEILLKANTYVQNSKNVETVEAANIALRAGQVLERDASTLSEAKRSYEFAYGMIDDTDARKGNVLAKISSLKASLKACLESETFDVTPHAMPNPRSSVSDKSSLVGTQKVVTKEARAEQQLAELVKQSEVQLDSLRTNAEHAERFERPNQPEQWISLAQAEALTNHSDEAIKHARLAIEKYKREGDIALHSTAILPAGGIDCIPDSLRRNGRAEDAQTLLKEAIDKTAAENGPNSSLLAKQLSYVCGYWLSAKDDAQALKSLDDLLALPVRVLDIGGPSSVLESLYRRSEYLQREDRSEMGWSILQRVLDAQTKHLQPDDYRLSTTKLKMGEFALAAGKDGDAEKYLFEAIKIRTKYDGVKAISNQYDALKKLLPRVGREADNKWIACMYFGQLSPTLVRELGFVDEADALEKTNQLPKSYAPEQIDRQTYENSKLVPYGEPVFRVNERQLQECLRNRDWTGLLKSATALTEIYSRKPDSYAGRQIGCVPPNTHRIDYYVAGAKAENKLGDVAKAQGWVQRAVDDLAELSCYEFQQLAEIEIEIGDNKSAERFLDSAVSRLTLQYSVVGGSIPYLYKKIDRPKSAEITSEKLRSIESAYNKSQADSRKKNEVFRETTF